MIANGIRHLVVGCAVLSATVSSAAAQERPGQGPQEWAWAQCAPMDLHAVIAIEQYGSAPDASSRVLNLAFTRMVLARRMCAQGRVADAAILYDAVMPRPRERAAAAGDGMRAGR